tara:strand:+ start:42 stop:506 length:465 start_codon:yes stop_codon:yes gene_type:complete
MTTTITGALGIDNIKAATGAVLQVVNVTFATVVSTGATGWSDSGMSLTITPTSATSKILLFASHNGIYRTGASYLGSTLNRNSTQLIRFDGSAGYDVGSGSHYLTGSSVSYLDSPATTSATTYKTQFKSGNNADPVGINIDGAVSTLTAMEIQG